MNEEKKNMVTDEKRFFLGLAFLISVNLSRDQLRDLADRAKFGERIRQI